MVDQSFIVDRRLLPKAKALDVRRVIRSVIATSTNRDDLIAARNAFLALNGLKACAFIDRVDIEQRQATLTFKARSVLIDAFNSSLKEKE